MTASFIRWAGSKQKLLPVIRQRLPKDFRRYIEPFCGSASLFFSLGGPPAVLSDINKDLIDTLITVRDSPKEVWRLAKAHGDPTENYYDVRGLDPTTLTQLERAARFLYLNRYCFNGVYRTNRSGDFNVPLGKKTGKFPDLQMLNECSAQLKNASIRCGDFQKTLLSATGEDFVYLDPPYFKTGRRAYGEYGYESFREKDLERLKATLKDLEERGVRFLISYSLHNADQLNESTRTIEVINAPRHVSGFNRGRKGAKEVLIRNYTIP